MVFMETLNSLELRSIKGGSISLKAAASVFSGVIFLIGVLDGFFRPYKCR